MVDAAQLRSALRRHAGAALQWYRTPSGIVFAIGVALLAVGLVPFPASFLVAIAGVIVLAVFFPYKFLREQARADESAYEQAAAVADQLQRSLAELRETVTDLAAGAAEDREAAARIREDVAARLVASERALIQWWTTARIADREPADHHEGTALDGLAAQVQDVGIAASPRREESDQRSS